MRKKSPEIKAQEKAAHEKYLSNRKMITAKVHILCAYTDDTVSTEEFEENKRIITDGYAKDTKFDLLFSIADDSEGIYGTDVYLVFDRWETMDEVETRLELEAFEKERLRNIELRELEELRRLSEKYGMTLHKK